VVDFTSKAFTGSENDEPQITGPATPSECYYYYYYYYYYHYYYYYYYYC